MKEELRAAEEELAAAEAERDALLDAGAEPARSLGARRRHRRGRRGDPPRRRAEARRARAHRGRAASRWSARARLSGSRFGYLVGDTALLALALYRFALDRAAEHGHMPMLPPVLVREEAMYGTGFFPTEKSNIYALDGRRPLPHRHLRGRARRLPHGRDPRRAAAALRRVLDVLPPRGGRGRQGHARHVPRPPVQQGRAVRLLRARALAPRSTTGCSRSRRSSCRRSACRTASSTSPPATSAPRRRRSTTSRRGSRRSSATARSRRRRTRPTSRPAASASATAPTTKRLETPHTLNGTAVTDRWLLAILENFGGDVPDVLQRYGAPARVAK